MAGALARFSPAARAWFREAFDGPTPVQVAAWEAIGRGDNTLVIAPTGSGKTLAAFLYGIDSLMRQPRVGAGVRVLYVSPLKALGVDVERNLKVPLAGIARTAVELGLPSAEVHVGVRTGDTAPADRRRLVAHPPQILITTPESLFLMLSSSAASVLESVDTVIVDEVHYLAGNKRGAHLAVSLERLEGLNRLNKIQRIGLSATVRPPEVVARFLVGRDRPVTIVDPPATKTWDLRVLVPVEDLAQLPGPSVWPYAEQEILDLVLAHRSTICFCNSRGVAERLTSHLNELYAQAHPDDEIIARAHHGSVAKAVRAQIEADLKAGRLPCVVATNSLELGIDMGAVDLVIQVGAPLSVASGLQRIGRGGHQVSAVSKGVLVPLSRGDLLATAAVTRRMGAAEIEPIHPVRNSLDVLAQHIVSMCVDHPVAVETIWSVVRRADCLADLPRPAFDAVVEMLTGAYPSDDFAELRPRLVLDRQTGLLTARPGARRLVTTSGGTIPDRGLYQVVMTGDAPGGSGKHAVSRRVGELDEEMVYESRVGDRFALGASTWAIEQITANQVIVSPAPGQVARIPFWHGDELSRPIEVGRAIQELVATLGSAEADSPGLPDDFVDKRAWGNLWSYVHDQMAATEVLPDARTIVVERHRDELGAWRVCVHAALGKAVLQPWALAIRSRLGGEARTYVTDDGIVIRLGEVEDPAVAASLVFAPAEITDIVTGQLQESSLFAARFRQCASRALLLPRRDPGQRTPLWQQRLRAAKLLGVASAYPGFPIMAEAMRECLEDVFDMDGLRGLMGDVAAGRVRLVEVATPRPSPFAASMLFGFVGAALYDDDPALTGRLDGRLVDPELLASLLGQPEQRLDEAALVEVEAGLQRLSPSREARTAEGLWDLLRQIGPLTRDECVARCAGEAGDWVDEMTGAGRIGVVEIGGREMLAVQQDLGWLAELYGQGEPEATDPVSSCRRQDLGNPRSPMRSCLRQDDEEEPRSHETRWIQGESPGQVGVARLVTRWVRHHGLVTPDGIAARFGLPEVVVRTCLDSLVADGSVEHGRFGGDGVSYIAVEVLESVRRVAIRQARARVAPVSQARFASFLVGWADVDGRGEGLDGLAAAVERLAGYPVPASMLESVVLGARVRDYHPAMLDQLLASGDVTWSGHGTIGNKDGWVCLWPGDVPLLQRRTPVGELSEEAQELWEKLSGGGAWTAEDLGQPGEALWELVWAGWVSSDGLAPVRALVQGTGALRKVRPTQVRRLGRRTLARAVVPRRSSVGGRWHAVVGEELEEAERLVEAVGVQLDRYGILTRASVLTEAMTPSYFDVYKVASAMEAQGMVRRGYFVENLGPAQFALPGAADRLWDHDQSGWVLLAACDPANPWGAALEWPASEGHRPTRGAGGLVVLDDGWPVAYLERGAHTLVTFGGNPDQVGAALRLVGDWIDQRRLDEITLTRINNETALAARPWRTALEQAGFIMGPQGFRRRAKIA